MNNTTSSKFTTLVAKYKIEKGDNKPITHTRLGNVKYNVYPNKLSVPDEDNEKFYKSYYQYVINEGNTEYYTETQNKYEPNNVCIDLDFRYKKLERSYSTEDIYGFVDLVICEYIEILNITNDINAYIFERQNPYIKEEENGNTINKDGIHIVIPLKCSREVQCYVRDKCINFIGSLYFRNDNIINEPNDIFDDCITNGTNNWMVAFSTKPNVEPYKPTYKITATYEDNDFCISEKLIPIENIEFDEFYNLSTKYNKNPSCSIKEDIDDKTLKLINKFKPKSRTTSQPFKKSLIKNNRLQAELTDEDPIDTNIISNLRKAINGLKPYRLENYKNWFDIGAIIYNETAGSDDGLELYESISWDDEKTIKLIENNWNNYENFYDTHEKDKLLKFSSIMLWLKEDNPELFKTLQFNLSPDMIFKSLYGENSNSETLIASAFLDYYKNTIITNFGITYVYNDVYWEECDKINSAISNKLNKFREVIVQYRQDLRNQILNNDEDNENEFKQKLCDNLSITAKTLTSVNTKRNITKEIICQSTNNSIKFDSYDNFLAFNNKVYDLINGKWIEPKKEYYISITTGYNWIEPSKESIDEVYDTLNIILPNKEVRDFYLTVCASGLFGDVLQNLILALGRGRNGKGCINELIKLSLGNYAYLLNSAILTQPIKDGLNADVANMNNKRLVITREPPSNAYVNNTTLRSITGGGNITCRGLYEDGKSSKEFKNTTIMETNDFLKFKTKIELADKERLIIVPFKTQFVKIIEDVDESNHYYLGNDKYTSNEWRKQNKYAMMKILLDYSKIFLQNDRNIKKSMPEIIKNTTYKYLERADFIVKWITETIQPSKDKKSYVSINELWNEHFRGSETYISLSKAQRREEGSKKGFINYIETSLFFSKYYHERKKIGGKDRRHILLGFEYIQEEKEETKCKIPDETDSNSDSE